ncbi:ATP-binding protein [Hymenobacter sp. BT730]|uniref:ATP-binding protein n=1 Tax=Hymenobacter sp. BT730 TaxID=3063332 RepID=UPI0026DFE4ED|nr:ATP-binding protein [Hymenobacter sp. BT730]
MNRELEELRQRLQEAEDLIYAIRTGAVDALAVQGADGPRIFTLEGADQGYRTLIEQMSEGALLLSPDGTILYCNAALSGLLQVALPEMIGGSFHGFVPKGFQAYWKSLLVKGWAGKTRGEMPLRTSAGTLLPFSLSMNTLAFHQTPVLAIIITDVSSQREITHIRAQVAEQNALIDRKNQELKTQELARRVVEQAAAEAIRILESIPQIAWTANAQGVTTYLNRRWFAYIGESIDQPLDRQWSNHIHPDDRARSQARWEHSLATGEAFEIEYRFRNWQGEYRWMLGRALPSRNEQDQIIQWIGTCTDIHEHKLALEEIDQAQHQLQDKNEELTRVNVDLDNFIYTASHDLRAPINNIEGLVQALLEELPAAVQEEKEVHRILQMMQDSIDRFTTTVFHLTEVSKLQKEYGQPTALVKLLPIVEGVGLDLAPLIQQTGAQMEVDIPLDLAISFSEKNLRSVVYNLLSNALKYHAPSRPPRIQLRAYREADLVVLQVQDNGLGITPDNQGQLFTMFQRFHDHVPGSGVGLYMIKKIVENMGGWIEVQSTFQEGSTFMVYFKG